MWFKQQETIDSYFHAWGHIKWWVSQDHIIHKWFVALLFSEAQRNMTSSWTFQRKKLFNLISCLSSSLLVSSLFLLSGGSLSSCWTKWSKTEDLAPVLQPRPPYLPNEHSQSGHTQKPTRNDRDSFVVVGKGSILGVHHVWMDLKFDLIQCEYSLENRHTCQCRKTAPAQELCTLLTSVNISLVFWPSQGIGLIARGAQSEFSTAWTSTAWLFPKCLPFATITFLAIEAVKFTDQWRLDC